MREINYFLLLHNFELSIFTQYISLNNQLARNNIHIYTYIKWYTYIFIYRYHCIKLNRNSYEYGNVDWLVILFYLFYFIIILQPRNNFLWMRFATWANYLYLDILQLWNVEAMVKASHIGEVLGHLYFLQNIWKAKTTKTVINSYWNWNAVKKKKLTH